MGDRASVQVDSSIVKPDYQGHAAEVHAVFLPIVSVHERRPLYVEALARTHLESGHQHLISVAETGGFVSEIDCSILMQVIVLLRRVPAICVGVNVSGGTLRSGVERWLKLLAKATDVSHRIVIELTETEAFDNRWRLAAFVSAIRHYGARLAIDDYEPALFDDELVHRVSPDIIKVSNVWDGGVEMARERIRRYLVKASEFGVSDVVIEWVDAEWKLDLMADIRVPYAQGLFVGRHLSESELIEGCVSGQASFSVARRPLFAVCR